MPAVDYGIEFEYLLVDTRGPQAGRLRDIHSLDVARLAGLLADKPGLGDPALAEGDQGIRSGYWYLEGDERFDPDGRFADFIAKGVEIRTPPLPGVAAAIDSLLDIERQLAARLERDGLGLAIAGFDPLRTQYGYNPPLNAFEQRLRAGDREYEGMELSMLTYGPDINLSLPGWNTRRNLDAARKLNYYAPYIVPFSFSSPYCAGRPWHGWSRRTWLRCDRRPAVKLFLGLEEYAEQAERSPLLRPARLAREAGRIEFKAFDAMPSVELLAACCHLLTGICLASNLRGRSETRTWRCTVAPRCTPSTTRRSATAPVLPCTPPPRPRPRRQRHRRRRPRAPGPAAVEPHHAGSRSARQRPAVPSGRTGRQPGAGGGLLSGPRGIRSLAGATAGAKAWLSTYPPRPIFCIAKNLSTPLGFPSILIKCVSHEYHLPSSRRAYCCAQTRKPSPTKD
ncbi:glutamate-cysteine ligase family protein [Azotobacter sp. CWF10]